MTDDQHANPRAGRGDDLDPAFTASDFARMERYASGVRFISLIAIDADDDAWHTRVDTLETALDKAFAQCGLQNLTARELRHHAGRGTRVRNQQWRLPSPHAPRALSKLLDLAIVTDNFGFDSNTYVSAD